MKNLVLELLMILFVLVGIKLSVLGLSEEKIRYMNYIIIDYSDDIFLSCLTFSSGIICLIVAFLISKYLDLNERIF